MLDCVEGSAYEPLVLFLAQNTTLIIGAASDVIMAAAVYSALLLGPRDVGMDPGSNRVCWILQLCAQCRGLPAAQTHAAGASRVHIQVEAIWSNLCELQYCKVYCF